MKTEPMDKFNFASRLIWDLHHEMASTSGKRMPCPTEDCQNKARGGGKCAECLTGELSVLVGNPLATEFFDALASVVAIREGILTEVAKHSEPEEPEKPASKKIADITDMIPAIQWKLNEIDKRLEGVERIEREDIEERLGAVGRGWAKNGRR